MAGQLSHLSVRIHAGEHSACSNAQQRTYWLSVKCQLTEPQLKRNTVTVQNRGFLNNLRLPRGLSPFPVGLLHTSPVLSVMEGGAEKHCSPALKRKVNEQDD